MAVVIETTLGDLTIDLFIDERPRACQNFLKLCKLKYYNYNLFHNIERGFIAQTGDPTGAGDGGESVWGVVEGAHKKYFEAESLPKIKHTSPGQVSMVSVGKNMIGSQFFFTLGSDLISLDGVHCVIGLITEGFDVLRKINEAIVDENYRPYQDIRITHTVILEDPFDDPRGFQIPSRSPSPSVERLKNGRIGADEDIDDTEGKTTQEIQEMLQEREAQARAIILEIVGDLPDADIAPPENVLFVCKLNPVTNDDDLEIIFSRFGKVKTCEVIRDKITGDSLQYAFVEFEDKKSCENAFFKMDNVLIDDRRIHVDFSQSVAKVKWRGKGRGVVRADGKESGRIDFDNLRQTTNIRSQFKNSGPRNHRGEPRDFKGQTRTRAEKPARQPRSKSRSVSRDRTRTRHRSRSRSPVERNRRRRDDGHNNPSSDMHRRERYSRSPSSYNRNVHRRPQEYKKYDKSSKGRNSHRHIEHRDKDRLPKNRYEYDKADKMKPNRHSPRRSPTRELSNRRHHRSPVRKKSERCPPTSSENEYEKYNARKDDKNKKERRNEGEPAKPVDSKSQKIKERFSEDNAINKKHEKAQSVNNRVPRKIVKRKKSSSSSSSSDSSESSSTSSSSSSKESRKRNQKAPAIKIRNNSSKKRRTSSSSTSSSSG